MLLLLLAQIISMQLGSVVAKSLYDQVSPTGLAGVRLVGSAVILGLIVRPRFARMSRSQLYTAIALGACLAVMNTSFFNAIQHLPIGVASTFELLGPLVLALALARGPGVISAALLAAAGTVLLAAPGGELPPVGVGLGLLAALARATYVLLNRRVGRAFLNWDGIAVALLIGGLLVGPIAVVADGATLLRRPTLLLPGIGIALLSSVIPYTLDLVVLRRLPVQTFGILLSLSPAIGALIAYLFLGEELEPRQLAAVALIVVASCIAVRTTTRYDTSTLIGQRPGGTA